MFCYQKCTACVYDRFHTNKIRFTIINKTYTVEIQNQVYKIYGKDFNYDKRQSAIPKFIGLVTPKIQPTHFTKS